jgi:WD40 repeat protein
VYTAAFCANDTQVVACVADLKDVRLWDWADPGVGGKRLVEAQDGPLTVHPVVSDDGKWIVVGSYNGKVLVWDASTGKRINEFQTSSELDDIRLSGNGKWLVTQHRDGKSFLWELQTGESLAQLVVGIQSTRRLAVNQDGTKVAARTEQGEVWLDTCDVCADLKELVQMGQKHKKRELTSQERRKYVD